MTCSRGRASPSDYSKPNAEYADLFRLAVNITPTPCIVRVNGVCMAGGMGLLCMGDMAVAYSHVKFGLPEVKVGLFPMQVPSLMQRLVFRRILREWTLTGEPFTATETQLATMALTEDAKEGMAAFNEKRAPRWPGR